MKKLLLLSVVLGLSTSTAWSQEISIKPSEPLRLTLSQMESVTAGGSLALTLISALASGDSTLINGVASSFATDDVANSSGTVFVGSSVEPDSDIAGNQSAGQASADAFGDNTLTITDAFAQTTSLSSALMLLSLAGVD